MREGRTVEVKADCALRTVFRQSQPNELGLGIDKSADQPRRADPIDPHAPPGRPNAPSIVFAIAAHELAFDRMRLPGRELGGQSRLRIAHRPLELGTRLAREKIHRAERRRLPSCSGQASACLALIEVREFPPKRMQCRYERLVVRCAVEQRSKRVALIATRLAGEFEDVGRAAAALNLLPLSFEHLSRPIRRRQHVHAVAQRASPRGFEGPPNAHAQSLVSSR